jgi:hypothetical protein
MPGSGGGGLSGIQEFTQTGTFTVPAGVMHVLAELWGAGGLSGTAGLDYNNSSSCGPFGQQSCTTFCPGGKAGLGGNGGYTRAVISVNPGVTYTVVIGVGGSLQQGGTDSEILDASENTLVKAGGGTNGSSGTNGSVSGAGCANGVDGTSGTNGLGGTGSNVIGRDGTFQGPPSGSIPPPPSVGFSGQTPGPGYVLFVW